MKKLIFILASLTLVLSACKETEQDRIADAQSCLDESTPSTAQSCVDMVSGIESKGAYLIRCSALFIQEGFMDANRLSNAMDQIENGGGASNSMNMMEVLAFSQFGGAAANENAANLAVDYCERAGSKGLVMLASLSAIATTSENLAAGDVSAGLANIAGGGSPAQAAVIGNAALAAYESNCAGDGGSFGEFCDQFESAIGGLSDPALIGQQLAICYTTPATPGCEGF